VDTLSPEDSVEHEYASTFHLDAPTATVDPATRAVSVTNDAGVRLGILPVAVPSLETTIIVGQMKPVVQGWLPKEHGRTGAFPRPCAYFTVRGSGRMRLMYVFAPAAAGQPLPVTAFEGTPPSGATSSATIHLTNGKRHHVSLSPSGDLTFEGGSRSKPLVLPPAPTERVSRS
jgi:hypothetical protein